MSDLATLGLAIDTRPALDAATALDKMGEAATRGESRVKQIAMASDVLVAALNRNTAATSALTSRMDETDRANARVSASMRGVDRAASDTASTLGGLATGYGQTGTAALNAARATDSVAASTAKHVSASAQATTATARATSAHNDNAKAAGLSANELRNLTFQLNDVTTMALSGASAFQIAATQGGQFFQIAQMAGGGVRGLFTQAGDAASAMASRIGLVGAGLGSVAIGLATATAAAVMFRNEQKELDRTTFGAGRASGASLYDLQRSAMEAAASGRTSGSQAREVVGALNATGRVSPGVYADVAKNMEDLSKLMGSDVPTATESMTSALASGISGFDRLNASLGLGGAAMRENLKDLYESGRGFEAQRLIVDSLSARIKEFKRETGEPGYFSRVFGAINRGFGQNTSDEMSGIGSVFRRRTPEESLAGARQALANGQAQVAAGLAPASSLDAARANVEKMEASVAETARQSREAKTQLASLTVQPLVDSLNPAQKRVEAIQLQAQSIQKYLAEGGIDKDGSIRRTMDGLNGQAKQLADDLTRGGTGLAAGLREAQFNLRTVGFADAARQPASLRERAAAEITALRGSNMELGARDQQIATIEEKLRVDLERLAQIATQTTGQYATNLRQVPEQYRERVYGAATANGIDPNLLASVFYKESRFRPEVIDGSVRSSAGAVGPFQFMPPTARGMGVDPLNFDSAANGAARLLSQRIQARGGNVALALADYNYGQGNVDKKGGDVSRFPAETRDYISTIMRQTPDTAAQSEELVARKRALEGEAQALRLATEAGGRDAEGLKARTEAAQAIAAAQARGIDVSKDLAAQYGREAAERARLATSGRMLQFNLDTDFDRDQIGRSRTDQNAFARARAVVGDVTSPQADSVIEQSRLNDNLRETKALATSAFSGMINDLRQGTSLASTLGNLTNRLADKLLSTASDRVISGLFSGGMSKDGGGFLSGLAGLFGSATLPKFADGGISRGPAIFGEAGPEAAVPLPDGRRIPVQLQGPANANQSPAKIELSVVNQMPNAQITTREVDDGRGGRKQEIMVSEVFAAGARSPKGQAALNQRRLAST